MPQRPLPTDRATTTARRFGSGLPDAAPQARTSLDRSVGGWIARRALIDPDATAIRTVPEQLTYRALAERIEGAAGGLAALGVRPGDRVAFSGPAGVSYVETLFGTLQLGAVFTPINPALPGDVAAAIVGDAEPRVLIRSSDSSLATVRLPHRRSREVPIGELRHERRPKEPAQVSPEEVALLAWTSGTTGRPKGVMLTHANLFWNAVNISTVADFRAGDVVLVAASFYRMGGLSVALQALFTGGTLALPPTVEPAALLRSIVDWRAVIVFSGPEQFGALAATPGFDAADLSALRFVFAGGSPFPAPLVRRYRERGSGVAGGYGLSEAAPLLLFANDRRLERAPGTAGVPPLFVDVRIVDRDDVDVPIDVPGELIARGPNIMPGYWGRPEATAAKLRGGWLRTGDVARREADGSIRILGRADDVITTREGPVFSGELERFILEHCPTVAEAVALDLPDGAVARPAVAVALRAGATTSAGEIEAALASAGPSGAASGVGVFVVPSIPRSAAGKALRGQLREEIAQMGAVRSDRSVNG